MEVLRGERGLCSALASLLMKQWKGVVIHHSEAADNGMLKDLEAIRRYHIEHNGWADIGYHFIIEKVAGEYRVFAGRSLEKDGAHAIGFNGTHIGICCVGNFDIYSPEEELYRCLSNVIAILKHIYGFKKTDIIGHRDTYLLRGEKMFKSCPGRRFDLTKIY